MLLQVATATDGRHSHVNVGRKPMSNADTRASVISHAFESNEPGNSELLAAAAGDEPSEVVRAHLAERAICREPVEQLKADLAGRRSRRG